MKDNDPTAVGHTFAQSHKGKLRPQGSTYFAEYIELEMTDGEGRTWTLFVVFGITLSYHQNNVNGYDRLKFFLEWKVFRDRA
jgi:hypothetical protein